MTNWYVPGFNVWYNSCPVFVRELKYVAPVSVWMSLILTCKESREATKAENMLWEGRVKEIL